MPKTSAHEPMTVAGTTPGQPPAGTANPRGPTSPELSGGVAPGVRKTTVPVLAPARIAMRRLSVSTWRRGPGVGDRAMWSKLRVLETRRSRRSCRIQRNVQSLLRDLAARPADRMDALRHGARTALRCKRKSAREAQATEVTTHQAVAPRTPLMFQPARALRGPTYRCCTEPGGSSPCGFRARATGRPAQANARRHHPC